MAWIADVVPQTTIRSVWGNGIRDRTIHQFASKAERDAVAANVLVDGMQCWTAAEQTLWARRGGQWWPMWAPYRTFGPHVWSSPVGGSTWFPAVGQTVIEYQYQRVGDVVNVNASVDFQSGTIGTAYVAISLPYDPFPNVAPKALGNGELVDNVAGVVRSAGFIYPGPIPYSGVNYPVASVDSQVVTQPNPNGRLLFGISYRTNDLRDVSPYG